MGNVNTDRAYNYIRSQILSGKYPPGFDLIGNALALEIGVSRTPIREALLQLESDGLVSIRARLGASVKVMDVREFRELSGLRKALEGYAAGLAAEERSEAELQEIRFALEVLREQTEREIAAEQGQLAIDEGVREDAQFHIAIINAAKNDHLRREIVRLHLINGLMCARIALTRKEPATSSDRADFIAFSRNVHAEHQAIYEAIAQRDAVAAEAAMKRHVQNMIDINFRSILRAENRMIARELVSSELTHRGERKSESDQSR